MSTTATSSTADKPILLVVGASFGGLGCLHELASTKDNKYRIVVVDSRDWFSIGGTWQFVWTNRVPNLDYTRRSLHDVTIFNDNAADIEWRLQTTVKEWNPQKKQVVLQKDQETETTIFTYDTMVLACGAVPRPDSIPGLAEIVNICNYNDVPRQKEQVQRLLEIAKDLDQKNHEKLTFCLAIGACPYKCPPAPFELTFLLDELLVQHGIRDRVRLVITCPVAWPMPPAFEAAFRQEYTKRGIEFWNLHELVRVQDETDTNTTTLHFANGATLSNVAVVWATFPLTAPEFVKSALPKENMSDSGFVRVADRVTHTLSNDKDSPLSKVHAIGDCCIVPVEGYKGLTVPKAGEFAWKMGQSAAQAILQINKTVDRKAACVAEMGNGRGLALVSNLSAYCAGTGSPEFCIEPSETGQARKVAWVNHYHQMIFGPQTPSLELTPASLAEEAEKKDTLESGKSLREEKQKNENALVDDTTPISRKKQRTDAMS